jgi:hypothetical protein
MYTFRLIRNDEKLIKFFYYILNEVENAGIRFFSFESFPKIELIDQEFDKEKIKYLIHQNGSSFSVSFKINIENEDIIGFSKSGDGYSCGIWIENYMYNILFKIIENKQFTFGKTHKFDDEYINNTSEIKSWQYENAPIPPYARLIPVFDFDDKNAKQIDLESLPGHSHQTNGINDEGLWFGACWQMYFSEIYYKYIPKPLFDAFTDCFENVVLENGVRKITLYQNPDDYDLPDSRRRQFEFRKQLGIDTIGHELTMPVDLYIDDNLPVYITKKNIAEGQTKVIRYLDATKNLVIKKKASFKETKIYLEDGVTVVFEQLEKKNFFGNFV